MAISRKEIEHIAKLARLDSNGDIFERLAEDMQGIVGMVDKLQQLDLGDITDQLDLQHKNALRADTVQPDGNPEALLRPNAPDFQAGGVAVPRVVE